MPIGKIFFVGLGPTSNIGREMNPKFKAFIEYKNFDYYCNQHTPIFHWTHIDNLDNILKNNGLFSHNEMNKRNIKYKDISDREIQGRRAIKALDSNKTIHDCIPFYFSPNNAMFYRIKCNNKDNFDNLICLITTKQKIDNLGLDYCFTDMNASKKFMKYFNKNAKVNKAIDERVFFDKPIVTGGYCKYYNSSVEKGYPTREERRQAEFLILKNFLNISCIDFFVARNENNCEIVLDKLNKYNIYNNNIALVTDW